ncbi:hypothetical protein SLE2022_177540 [Rubroshorea leprosula]
MAKSAAASCSDTAAVQATNDDATANENGYRKYGYIHLFVRKPVKRSPITNSGRSRYYLLELNLIHHIFSKNKEVLSDL